MAERLSYFALLGVGEDVNQEELEARYQELADHLTSPAIPAHLQEWARRQAALVDEAYAVLSDPERRAAVRREREAEAPAAAIAPVGRSAEPQKESLDGTEAEDETRRASPRPRHPETDVSYGTRGLRLRPIMAGVLIGLLVLGAVLLGRYGLPWDGSGETIPEAEQAGALVPLDTERIAELEEAAQQDPNDTEALFELGEMYFQANEWQSAIDWFTKFLAIDADNIHARTDVGTSHFNLGHPKKAEAAWLAVLKIDPDDVQSHYNLGFVYANAEPQDIPSAVREWEKVVNLAPDSELAAIAQAHLDGMSDYAGEGTPPTPSEETGGTDETD